MQPLLSDHNKNGLNTCCKDGACPVSTNNTRHLDTARSYIGTIEKTNHNDGPVVERFLRSVGRKKGESWCAAFVSYCLQAGNASFPLVRSGIARSFKLSGSIKAKDVLIGKYKILPGTIIVWEKGNTVFGHVGFVESWDKQSGITIEGNTSSDRNSVVNKAVISNEGVYRKRRSIEPANYFRITCFTQVTSPMDKVQSVK
ncbi:MAG: CHAP domain-containing protein [Ignavibacteriaceae bacterium]|nr:CHAP domain-containing protein [Ignavibacteriaceae bacterium]